MSEHDWIFLIVKKFYSKVQIDVLIGYHFRNVKDFDTHIPRIATFWDIQLLGTTERKLSHPFDVLEVHRPLMIKRGELDRWLLLLKKTIDEESIEERFLILKNSWLEKLVFFESVFSRSFGI